MPITNSTWFPEAGVPFSRHILLTRFIFCGNYSFISKRHPGVWPHCVSNTYRSQTATGLHFFSFLVVARHSALMAYPLIIVVDWRVIVLRRRRRHISRSCQKETLR